MRHGRRDFDGPEPRYHSDHIQADGCAMILLMLAGVFLLPILLPFWLLAKLKELLRDQR